MCPDTQYNHIYRRCPPPPGLNMASVSAATQTATHELQPAPASAPSMAASTAPGMRDPVRVHISRPSPTLTSHLCVNPAPPSPYPPVVRCAHERSARLDLTFDVQIRPMRRDVIPTAVHMPTLTHSLTPSSSIFLTYTPGCRIHITSPCSALLYSTALG